MKEMDDCNLLKKKILCIRKESRKVRKTYEIKMYCYIQHMLLKESSFFHTFFFAKLNDMIMRPYFVGRRAILLIFLQNTLIMTSCMTMIRIDFSKSLLHHIMKIISEHKHSYIHTYIWLSQSTYVHNKHIAYVYTYILYIV